MVRKIEEKVPDELLQQDLEKYRQRAIELGATDAKIITTDMILIDERVLAKCIYPKCRHYGTNADCPPHAMDLDSVRKVVNKFRYAIFYMMKVPSEMMAGPEARTKGLFRPTQVKSFEITSKIEAEAFYDGYHLALGFAGGPCKSAFCPNDECSALVPGQPCRHALRARSSMEAVGMDVFTMAAKIGWDIYPIGASISPSEVSHGMRLGLVLIY
jgi:predicted metal-binding protein